MASKYTNTVETDVFDITEDNLPEKFSEHMSDVYKLMKFLKYKNVRILTRIKDIAPRKAFIHTDIEEEIRKITGEE